jgi:EmrB/QacA subfamily drug resistance transporter
MDQRETRRRWHVLGVLVVTLLVVMLDNTVLSVALGTIADPKRGLGASQSQLEWAFNSYTLAFAGLLFAWGVLADRLGRKRILIAGLSVFGLASLLSAYVQTPGQLIAARAVMGIGGAAVMPVSLSIITHVFPPAERARAIAIWVGSIGLAIAIGPVTSGILLEYWWWGSIFLINVPIVAAGLVVIGLIVPESRDPAPGRPDPVGMSLSTLGVTGLAYGIIEGGRTAVWMAPGVLLPIAAAVALLGIFVAYERGIAHPALDVRLFALPRFSAAAAAIAIASFVIFAVLFITTFYLQSVRGYSPLRTGVLLLPLALAQMLLAPRSAKLARLFGTRLVISGGLALLGVGMAGYARLGAHSSLWMVGLVLGIIGGALGLSIPPAVDSMMAAAPLRRSGTAAATGNAMRQIGGALGIAVLGSILSVTYRDRIGGELGVLPAGLRRAAGESLSATLATLDRMGIQDAALAHAARESYVGAMHLTAVIAAVGALAGAATVLAWLPRDSAAPAVDAAPPAVDAPPPVSLPPRVAG